MRIVRKARVVTRTVVSLLLMAGSAAALHPHFSLEGMAQRVREIDAVLLAAPPSNAREKALLLEEQGQMLDGIGRLAEAMMAFEEAIRLAPKDPRTLYNYATMLLWRGLPTEAESWLEAAVRLDSREVRYLELLARARAQAGRLEQAAETWIEAARVERSRALKAEKLGAAARALERAGRSEQARALLDQALAITPGDPFWLLERARFFTRHKAPLAAARDLARVEMAAPKHPDLHVWQLERGEALYDAGRGGEAAQALESALEGTARALAEDPAFPEDLFFQRARALFRLSRPVEAAQQLRKALEWLPAEPLYLELGIALFPAAGAPDQAEKCRQALAEEQRRMQEAQAEDRGDQEARDRELARQVELSRHLRRVHAALREGRGEEEALAALAKQGPEGVGLTRRARSTWLERSGRAEEALAVLGSLPRKEADDEAWVAGLRWRCLKTLGREEEAGADRKRVETYLEASKR